MADIVTTQVFSDGERGITAQKLNNIVALSQIQTAFYNAKPTTSSFDPADMLLTLKASGSYAQVSGTNVAASIGSATFGASRLRSYNAIGNSTFECDQRNVNNSLAFGTGAVGQMVCDRWNLSKVTATGTFSTRAFIDSTPIVVPGTNFQISRTRLIVTLTAQQASLAAGEYINVIQQVEGPMLRELVNDVHSVSILAQCTSAPFTFTIALSTAAAPFYTLTKLCQITTANQWTLFTLPNLPLWSPSGTWLIAPGNTGYNFRIGLGAGATYTSPANDTWQSGNFVSGPGSSNFASLAVNSQFSIAFVQHEPGASCTTLMDKPFAQNYDECLRYYTKSYDYGTAVGTNIAAGPIFTFVGASPQWATGWAPFPKPLAKSPTMTFYTPGGVLGSGTIFGGANVAITGNSSNSKALCAVSVGAAQTSGSGFQFHYTADTGW